MCEPTTLLAIGSAVAGHVAQAQQASAERKAARQAYASEQAQINEKYRQENAEISQEMSQRAHEAMVERGRLRAAYSEGGLSGNSLDNILRTNEFALGGDLSTMEANRGNVKRQTYAELHGARAAAQSRLNQAQSPSILSTGLQIAGSVAGDAKFKGTDFYKSTFG